MERDGRRGDEWCSNRSCGTCPPACTGTDYLTPGSWRAGRRLWGLGRILWRLASTAVWRQILQKRSRCESQREKSLHVDEGKKIGSG